MVFRPEIIDNEANPAGGQHQYGADDLSDDRDGLLANVDYRQDGEYKTD